MFDHKNENIIYLFIYLLHQNDVHIRKGNMEMKRKEMVQSPVSPKISDCRKFPTTVREQLESVRLEESADIVGNFRLSEMCGGTGLRIKHSNKHRNLNS